ncbi:MAG: hypothetical protein KAX49_13910 [Halanaerobiales bacterium]|nr:hypothetical protein [Halanaerobiales bacterium]
MPVLLLTSENNAATSEINASTSETNAAASASNAEMWKDAASTSAGNASASEAKAQKWAEEAEDMIVEFGEYSAKHHATKAYWSAMDSATWKSASSSTAATQAELKAEK